LDLEKSFVLRKILRNVERFRTVFERFLNAFERVRFFYAIGFER
jgi:hypothetical protein